MTPQAPTRGLPGRIEKNPWGCIPGNCVIAILHVHFVHLNSGRKAVMDGIRLNWPLLGGIFLSLFVWSCIFMLVF